ncbi:PREDICTED: uncharacterized protein LOC105457083 [Wasmannia auropunctata]|uniref:uncharacterized protein LOC105457083 n=1 Tax=Wasmannia auropunctata TaxID=64793 RepID=UPI0005EEAB20|nr:PREDICTED: uncharacterized protein LOC105457083 [Wasmannia auropunctata]
MDLPPMTKENVIDLRKITDGATRHIQALQALKRPTSYWDDLLIHILSHKLDALTLREWQLSLTSSELPTLRQFIDFIALRCQNLETNTKTNADSPRSFNTRSSVNAKRQSSCVATVKSRCNFCKGDHLVYYCQDFLALPAAQRLSEIRKLKTCTNCLRSTDHSSNKCTSGNCKICKSRHNTLLHLAAAAPAKAAASGSQDNTAASSGEAGPSNTLVTHSVSAFDNKCVMLSTALVFAYDCKGARKPCRVLLDSGSQANFISKRFSDLLNLKTRSLDISISGINKTATKSHQAAEVRLQSRTTPYSFSVDCIVTDHVTDKLPAFTLRRSAFEIPQNLKLADPQFHVASEIDMLIGAEHFWHLLCVGQIRASPAHPTLHKTRLGWVLAGRLGTPQSSRKTVQSFHASVTNTQLHNQLSRFWQLEDVAEAQNNYTDEETQCEQHFLQNMSRTAQGRFVVKLPFKRNELINLGDSKDIATRRFYNLERRFNRDLTLKSQYSQFINEYSALGHMKLIEEQHNDSESFYLPHHCVFKSASGSSKIRVVFDASSKSSSGISLNDALMVGPTVQQDLFSILLRFRTFRFVLAADIIKMYRQIQIHPSQTRYQRILWRDDPTSDIRTYELTTVTYGTSSASYLATRCLKWLAEQHVNEFPPDPHAADENRAATSKRVILSEVSRLFDPLGLLGPVIVLAKLILQELWQLGIHWDESVPQDLHSRWSRLRSGLADINQLSVPRCAKLNADPQSIQVHGFCDASQRAYGACIYIRTKLEGGVYHVELLCSKSRVAPLKTVSLPRLELLAALLLARLVKKISTSINLSEMQTFFWSDSTIVLNWIASPSRRWSTFVANRIGEIQSLTDPSDWRHVKSFNNPADILSRGLDPQELANSSMWWHGPSFLELNDDRWPSSEFSRTLEGLPEQRKCFSAVAVLDHLIINDLLIKHSNINKACRILAYCLRFSRARRPIAPSTFVSHQEISVALRIMCRSAQAQAFSAERNALCRGDAISASSHIASLSPFIDKEGLIRVGGRLVHGFCDASQRAYGACIYIRTKLEGGVYHVELLCSKSRVAPLKTVSLPRLELLAALLLARLVKKISTSINLSEMQTFFWSDSTIVLNWIASPSRRWSTFVANRISEIQSLTDPSDWRHVKSSNNPADILSRGLDPQELANSSMWWHGPSFLELNDDRWPSSEFSRTLEGLPEQRKCFSAVAVLNHLIVNDLLIKHSNINKACRILAYCLRISKARRPIAPSTFVSHQEISVALRIMCRSAQAQAFSAERNALCRGDAISASSHIASLSPFIDKEGLIRVGGRLVNSDLNFDARHQILLPRNHILTQRILEHEHTRSAHAGVQATMAVVRQRFWPISLRSTARKIIKNCVTCFKIRPVHSEAVMGPLPAGRVTVSRPFTHCGIDYAGPFMIRESKRRNAPSRKAYLAIFVCFATKGVHLELVSDLTSDSFIGALKRFVSRRGKPSCIYSDNGTTFVGAQRQLKEFFEFLRDDRIQTEIAHFLRDHETAWKFIPPNAPHVGGLWEAAVKSAKYHLYRIIGKSPLNFEELQTIFCEIESILNSRPLTPLSNDPNDLDYLSPGHFLIGTVLNSFPYNDLTDVNENRLVRWQRIEQARQHFWRRWSQEYLHTLQERSKWRTNKGDQLKPNQMVLLKQQGLAPLQWLLGRVQEVHPGADKVVRTATIRTAKGSFTRPLTKIAILPIDT